MGNELIIAVLLLNLQLNRMGLHISCIVYYNYNMFVCPDNQFPILL